MRSLLVLFVAVIVFLTNPFVSFGQETGSTEENTATVAAEYALPYPGILPDHPLYKLKVLRDKIMLFMIQDPKLRAEKYITYADKQLLAALKLAEKGNDDLAVHTAFKGENDMTLAVKEIIESKQQSQTLDESLVNKAHHAYQAHMRLLQGIKEQLDSEEHKSSLDLIEGFAKQNDETLQNLQNQPSKLDE